MAYQLLLLSRNYSWKQLRLHYPIALTLQELALYAKDVDTPHLKMELQMLPDLVKTYNETNYKICTVTIVRTVAQLLNDVSNSKGLFREVYKITKIFTIPVTTARTFSALVV